MTLRILLRRLTGGLLLTFCALVLSAAEPAKKNYNLPAGDAAATLKQFVTQSGEQVVYLVNTVRGVTTRPVSGDLTAREALERMLAGTDLTVVQDAKTGALTVNRAARAVAPAPGKEPTASSGPADKDGVVQLSPFEVNVGHDTGYGALQSSSLTAFRIDLAKMPATVEVFTQTFMDDVAASSIQDVLVNYSGVVGADPNNSGASVNNMAGDRDGSGGGVGIRGLAAPAPKRDGLSGARSLSRTPVGYNDTFSVDRIELIEGPQSLLYGAVGGGGVINSVSKRPIFDRQSGILQLRFDQYGSKREMLDYNYGTDNFAVRVAGLNTDARSARYNIGTDLYGLYASVGFRLGRNTTVRVFHELTDAWGNVAYNPASGDINNFFYQKDANGNIIRNAAGIPLINTSDPRRNQDVRYLALTGQLADLQGVLSDAPVDYNHISSFGSWWSAEHIRNDYNGLALESKLPWGFSVQLTGIYSETLDERATVSKNLVPQVGYTGAGANTLSETAVRITPSLNWQSDRTRAFRLNLLHEMDFSWGRLQGHSNSVLGIEGMHQGPAFGSSGIDQLYYQADSSWNVVTSPTITVDYGRIPLSNLYFPVQHGVPLKPLFRPATGQITVNGVNYVLQPRIKQDAAYETPTNPEGLVPNNPTASNPNQYAGNWNRGGDTHSKLVTLGNYTEWWDGKLTTIAGVSVNRFTTTNIGPGTVTYLPPHDYWGYQFGANYEIKPWLRAYGAVSTSGMSAGTTRDFYGNPLKVPKADALIPEIGLKLNTRDGRYTAQLAYNFTTQVTNETRNAGADLFNAVNPNGINGRFNAGDQWINLDRKANSAELTFSAVPVPNWRLRLRVVKLDGEITSTVKYNQLYNDQFYLNGSGVVTYQNGTPLLVDPNGANGPKTTPLTLAMINNPANPFYATPDPDSGRITKAALITALTTVDPVNGKAATSVTGLPVSAIQYNWTNPHNGEITVVEEGDQNTGISEYSVNFQTAYKFDTGVLKGLGVFGAVRTSYGNRAFYTSYFPTGTTNAAQASRVLYSQPTAAVVDFNISYTCKFKGRYTWTTQLNINNIFNHYKVAVLPSVANGANLNARLTNAPRLYIWSNTFGF